MALCGTTGRPVFPLIFENKRPQVLTFTLVTTSVGLSSDVLRMFSKKVFVSSGVMSSLLGKECNKAVLERKLLICSKKCMRTAPGRGDGFEGVEYGVVQLENGIQLWKVSTFNDTGYYTVSVDYLSFKNVFWGVPA